MRAFRWVQRLLKAERGQDATEYGLLVGLIAIIIIFGVGAFGLSLSQYWGNLATTVATWL